HSDYAEFHLDINSDMILDAIKGKLRNLLGDNGSKFVVDYLKRWLGGSLSFSVDARLAAAVTLGADTSFLQTKQISDSLFIGAGPIIDAAFNITASAHVPIVPQILSLSKGLVGGYVGQKMGEATGSLHQAEGEAGDEIQHVYDATANGLQDARDLAAGVLD